MGGILGVVAYRSFYTCMYVVGLLPMWMLYLISSFFAFLMFRLIPYRKSVVTQNLSRSFPDKSEMERKQMARDFYRCFTDNVVEIIKSFSITAEQQKQKVTVVGRELIEEQLRNNKHVIISMGHCGNWEVLNILSHQSAVDMFAVYKPLRNRTVDQLFFQLRSRFGMGLVPSQSIVRHILSNKENPSVYFFIADQCPRVVEEKYRLKMLNQQTSMFSGVEKLACLTNAAVLYMHVTRSCRGKYVITYKPITMNPKETKETEIIKHYALLLEQNIQESPSDWLWSHKRWKR